MEHQDQEMQTFMQSNTAKIMMVGFLTLILLIPLVFVQNLITERSQRQKEVVDETTAKWGGEVFCYGPVLKVPYYDKTTKSLETAYFFPDQLNTMTDVKMARELKRSIYKANVFTAGITFDGQFSNPNFNGLSIPAENIRWNETQVVLRTTNLSSINSEVKINVNGQNLTFEPVTSDKPSDSIATLESARFPITALSGQRFKMHLSYNGSHAIRFVPVGKTTKASMTGDWNSPSFTGNFLPGTQQIDKNGFSAQWNILHFNRPFNQQQFGALPDLSKYAYQVDLITPVDEYQQNERASKYGFLVIGLTFLVFFLIQSISKINIHIFQYTMIGIALVLFYTLLISITEHSSFTVAYAIAGTAIVAMITTYSLSILKNRKFPMLIGGALSLIYAFLFVIIQLEDYALLVGSIGLFAILAAVMYFSRKIDWSR